MEPLDDQSELSGESTLSYYLLIYFSVQWFADPIYRIICKTQLASSTHLTSNVRVLIRLIGDQSGSFFPLLHSRRLQSGSMQESLHRDVEYIAGVTHQSSRKFPSHLLRC